MTFHSPHILWLLVPLLGVLAVWIGRFLRESPDEVTYVRSTPALRAASRKPAWPTLLLSVGGILAVVGLAGPFQVVQAEESECVPQNIVIVTDLSASMLMEDYFRDGERINRLDASKSALADYLPSCVHDAVGLVTFAGEVKILAPLTSDTNPVAADVKQLEIGHLKDGTAIGDAIDAAIPLFTNAPQAGRANTMLLLSDGADNRSTITPADAARKAAGQGITIHTIGIGTDGIAPMPVFTDAGKKIGYRRAIADFNGEELAEIAAATGGRFSRAVDLQGIFQTLRLIRAEQNRRMITKQSSNDVSLMWNFAGPGVGLLVAGGLMKVLARTPPEVRA